MIKKRNPKPVANSTPVAKKAESSSSDDSSSDEDKNFGFYKKEDQDWLFCREITWAWARDKIKEIKEDTV